MVSLHFKGPGGATEHRWIAWALLRDCVQHYLGGERFPELLRVTEALGGRTGVTLGARALRAELEAAAALLDKPIGELAISERTRAVTSLAWSPGAMATQTQLASMSGGLPDIVGGAPQTLRDVFGPVVLGLLRITDGADERATVVVVDG